MASTKQGFQPPTLSLTAPLDHQLRQLKAGATAGLYVLEYEGPTPNFELAQPLFDLFAHNRQLRDRFNAVQPPNKPNYKGAAVFADMNRNKQALIDQKVSIDFNPKRLQALFSSDPALAADLAPHLQAAVQGMYGMADLLVDRVMDLLSAYQGEDVAGHHREHNLSFRYNMYFPRRSHTDADGGIHAPRCGAHRDFGSFTLLFQDENPGLQVNLNDEWLTLPPNCCILLFGWCTQIRSNDRLHAALHRVVDSPAGPDGVVPPRNTAVVFVAPDSSLKLTPMVHSGDLPRYKADITVEELKAIMARRWREREGTEESHGAAGPMSQDEIVNAQLRLHVPLDNTPAACTPACPVPPAPAIHA